MKRILAVVAALAVAGVGGLAGAMAWQYHRLVQYRRFKGLPVEDHPLDYVEHVRAEATAISKVAWWHVRGAFQDRLSIGEGRPVLCIHGFTQNGTNLWGIREALEARGRPTRAVSLGVAGWPIEHYVPKVEAAMRELSERSPEGFDVVAHSMGGLLVRLALARNPDLAAATRRIVTLGSPHKGTGSVRGVPPLFHEMRQMHRRSPWLKTVPRLSETVPHAKITTIAGKRDVVVYPGESCHLPGATRIDLPVGHTGLLTHREAIRAVVEALCSDDEPAARS